MSDQLVTGMITVALAMVSLATLSIILSKNANTPAVLSAGAQGFAADLEAAVEPITGGSFGGFGSFETSGGSSGNW